MTVQEMRADINRLKIPEGWEFEVNLKLGTVAIGGRFFHGQEASELIEELERGAVFFGVEEKQFIYWFTRGW